jgi:hypothetical protein
MNVSLGSLHTQRKVLPLCGVLLQCLDAKQEPIEGLYSSGFIREESGGYFLYTCWHVVTGFDPYGLRIGLELPKRRYLRISIQEVREQPGAQVIGGCVSFVLPLYANETAPLHPLWMQDDQHIPHPELNHVGIFLPFWHDAVKIQLPNKIRPSKLQLADYGRPVRPGLGSLAPGDKCLIVGFPYGYSTLGDTQPTPVALTRFIAADRVSGRRQQLLLESIGAPAMSGAPVFVEREECLHLFGLYTGSVYPDHASRVRRPETALGTVADVSLHLCGHLKMSNKPSTPVPEGAS